MSDVRAVRLLTTWKGSTRPTVSVTKQDYDELLYTLTPRRIAHCEGQVVFVVVDKNEATQFLKNKYNLHGVEDGLRLR